VREGQHVRQGTNLRRRERSAVGVEEHHRSGVGLDVGLDRNGHDAVAHGDAVCLATPGRDVDDVHEYRC
jgi:hypothetical protein